LIDLIGRSIDHNQYISSLGTLLHCIAWHAGLVLAGVYNSFFGEWSEAQRVCRSRLGPEARFGHMALFNIVRLTSFVKELGWAMFLDRRDEFYE